MDIYKQICAKLVEAWDNTADREYEDFGRAASYLVDWTRAELAEPEPEGPTDEQLLVAYSRALTAVVDDTPKPWPDDLVNRAQIAGLRAVLARWGNSSAPQPIPVSERWPEFSDCDDAYCVWCWNWRVGAWRLSRIDRSIHSHWLPAHALPAPEEVA